MLRNHNNAPCLCVSLSTDARVANLLRNKMEIVLFIAAAVTRPQLSRPDYQQTCNPFPVLMTSHIYQPVRTLFQSLWRHTSTSRWDVVGWRPAAVVTRSPFSTHTVWCFQHSHSAVFSAHTVWCFSTHTLVSSALTLWCLQPTRVSSRTLGFLHVSPRTLGFLHAHSGFLMFLHAHSGFFTYLHAHSGFSRILRRKRWHIATASDFIFCLLIYPPPPPNTHTHTHTHVHTE